MFICKKIQISCIVGDPKKLSAAMDGSCYNSGASHYGVKVCDCKSKGIYKQVIHRTMEEIAQEYTELQALMKISYIKHLMAGKCNILH